MHLVLLVAVSIIGFACNPIEPVEEEERSRDQLTELLGLPARQAAKNKTRRAIISLLIYGVVKHSSISPPPEGNVPINPLILVRIYGTYM